MRRSFLIVAVAALASCAFGQVNFDCYPDGTLPLDPSAGCEGVASNGLGGFGGPTAVTSSPACGFPTTGAKYCRLVCNGPVTVPNGGPFPWGAPQSSQASEVRIPIPAGSTTLSFDWEYFNAEGVGSSFNDGFAVAVVTSTGALVQELVYADNQVGTAFCNDPTNFATEISPGGIQSFAGPLPPLSPCDYLSIVCWNDGDNAVSGAAYVDNFAFDSALAACAVPCFGGAPQLQMSSPSGVSCIQVNMAGLPPNGSYFLAVSLVAGNFPNGWFNGIDISFTDLVALINLGPPFSGGTGTCGAAQVGEFCGAPSGLALYAVALGLNGPPLGSWSVTTPALSYVIP